MKSKLRMRIVAIIAAFTICLSVCAIGVAPVVAATSDGVQNVSVQIGPDGSVTELSSTTTVRGQSGTVTGDVVQLDPQTDGLQLPVRVSTSWWMDGQTGTDLSALKGKSGRVRIAINVDNLTLKPQEVSVEEQGARYRQYTLVGVPLTVTAATRLGKNTLGDIVTTDDGSGQVTNGVASQANTGESVIQWAALLAPPILPSVTTFNLVMDVNKFTPPEFDITVQPGLSTDPSFEQILALASGLESSESSREQITLDVVMNVADQLQQGQDLVEQVYNTISQDASQLGARTYSELQSSSQMILAQIESTKGRLEQLSSQASGQIASVQSGVTSDLSSLLNRLNTDVLGSTTDNLNLTDAPINGCQITLPELPADAPHTLASAVRLVQAQLGTVINAFDSSSDPNSDLNQNCRAMLIQTLQTELGGPTTQCLVDHLNDPLAPNGFDTASLKCTIRTAQSDATGLFTTLADIKQELVTKINNLGITELASQVAVLSTDMDTLRTNLTTLQSNLTNGLGTGGGVEAILEPVTTSLASTQQDASTVQDTIEAMVGNGPNSLNTLVSQIDAYSTQAAGLRTQAANQATDVNTYISYVNSTINGMTGQAGSISAAVPSLIDKVNGVEAAWNTPSTGGLSSDWQQQIVSQVNQLINGDPACSDWSASLTASSTTEDYVTALDGLSQESACPAASLAGLLSPLMSAYDQQEQAAAAPTSDFDAIRNGLTTINTTAQAISSASVSAPSLNNLSAVEQGLDQLATGLNGSNTSVDQSIRSLITQLNGALPELQGLWTEPVSPSQDGTGFLAEVQTAMNSVQESIQSGDLSQAVDALNDALDAFNIAYPLSAPTAPLVVASDGSCMDPAPDAGDYPSPSVNSVVWLSDYLSCQKAALLDRDNQGNDLSTWTNQVNANGLQNSLNQALTQDLTAFGTAETQINSLSNGLVSELQSKTGTITSDNLTTIDTVKNQNSQDLAKITQDFKTSTNSVVTSLNDQVNAANLDADSSRAALEQDFTTLLANLGNPDPSSRVGLLGKLRSTATATGDTVTMLDTVKQTTSSHGNVLTSQLLDLKLQTAQYQASQARADDLKNFPGVPDGVDVFTVFCVHVSGN